MVYGLTNVYVLGHRHVFDKTLARVFRHQWSCSALDVYYNYFGCCNSGNMMIDNNLDVFDKPSTLDRVLR